MKKIIYTNQEGVLCIVNPAPSFMRTGETEANFVARIIAKDVPSSATNVRVVDAEDIPTDRTFRDAWAACPESVCRVDMQKAREIHRERLRRARKPKLEALDVETMRNLTNSAKLAEIEAKKQELRDATAYPAIDSAATPEDLKLAVPSCLA